ncbi:metal-dependent hydrolase [Halomicroarcula sp. GCM10025324]|uniref:metal-dependent hydrolase n=1 Tax=Haloarcula TaxID=2237 RepID=UPI0023E8E6AF|nr:metal-dependent hydrolase [Halomicroarcula sp. ZS-22-S1]
MLPHGHLAVGYLLFSGYARATRRRRPEFREIAFVMLGTQLPDLFDKPLALLGGGFAGGRTVGHSMIFAVPFVLAVGVLIHGRTEAWGPAVAFAVGYVCHPFVDASLFLLQGTVAKDFLEVSFVVWPLTIPGPAIVSALTGVPGLSDLIAIKPVWTARHLPTAPVIGWWIRAAEAVLALLAAIVWWADGVPGMEKLPDGWIRIFE